MRNRDKKEKQIDDDDYWDRHNENERAEIKRDKERNRDNEKIEHRR